MTRLMRSNGGSSPMVGDRIHSLVDDLFQDFFSRSPWNRLNLGATDIYETDDALWIETALPGLKREDIQVRVKDNQLIVRGTYSPDEHVDEENYLYRGRPSGQFETAFPLPDQIDDVEKVQAHFEDGILKIQVPLREPVLNKGVEIEVQ